MGRAGQGWAAEKDVSRSRRCTSESESGSSDGPSRRCRGTFSGIGQHGGQYVVAMHPDELFEPFGKQVDRPRIQNGYRYYAILSFWAAHKIAACSSLTRIAPPRARAFYLNRWAHAAHPQPSGSLTAGPHSCSTLTNCMSLIHPGPQLPVHMRLPRSVSHVCRPIQDPGCLPGG